MTLHATSIELKYNDSIGSKFYRIEFKYIDLNLNSNFQRNTTQIDLENIIKLFIVSIIHDYGVENKQ